MVDDSLKVIHAPTLQKTLDDVKRLAKVVDSESTAYSVEDEEILRSLINNLQMLQEMQVDTVMTRTVKHSIGEATNTCIEKMSVLTNNGVYVDGACESVKDAAIFYLRRKNIEAASNTLEALKNIAWQHKEKRIHTLELLGMIACVALKSDLDDLAFYCADSINYLTCDLVIDADEEVEKTSLTMLQQIAGMAARMKNYNAFATVISKVAIHYATEKRVLVGTTMMSFVLDLLFIASDRRYIDALPMLKWISLHIIRDKKLTIADKQKFLHEWCILTAQMANRDWADVTKLLLNGICRFLVKEKDPILTKAVINDFSMHFQMHARKDGFERTYELYQPWHKFMLFLFDIALVSTRTKSDQEYIMQFIIRVKRDLVTGVARATMREEYEIYHEWLKLWLKSIGDNEKRQEMVRAFVQMTALYWHSTQMIASKKQWEYMKDIVEPSVLTDVQKEVLKNIT